MPEVPNAGELQAVPHMLEEHQEFSVLRAEQCHGSSRSASRYV